MSRRLPLLGRATAPTSRAPQGGFTLAEAAVTIALVALVLTVMLQSLEGAKVSAAHNRFRKTAYELGTGLLGEITAGIYMEDIESGMSGTFAELDEPDYAWEIVVGDDVFADADDGDTERPFDNYAARRDWESDQDTDDEDEDEETEEPFEKVKVRVTYPAIRNYPTYIDLEVWVPWDQVYGIDEEDELSGETNVGGPAGGNGDGGNNGNG